MTERTDDWRGVAGFPEVGILDFMYTFSLGLGLAPEWFGISWATPGFLASTIVSDPASLGAGQAIELAAFLTGLLTLLFSWYGYHVSIMTLGYKSEALPALGRFVIDAVLVLLYGFLLLHYRHPQTVLLGLVGVYLLYSLWDLLKIREFHDELYGDVPEADRWIGRALPDAFRRYYREWISPAFLMLMMGAYGAGTVAGPQTGIGVALVLTVGYRVAKNRVHAWLGIDRPGEPAV